MEIIDRYHNSLEVGGIDDREIIVTTYDSDEMLINYHYLTNDQAQLLALHLLQACGLVPKETEDDEVPK